VAETALDLRSLVGELNAPDIWALDLNALDRRAAEMEKRAARRKSVLPGKYAEFQKKIAAIHHAVAFLRGLRGALDEWRGNKRSLDAFQKVADSLRDGSTLVETLPPIGRLIDKVKAELRAFIAESIAAIKPGPDKKALRECAEMEKFIISLGDFGLTSNYRNLESLKTRISLEIGKACDTLYESYQEAVSAEDAEKAGKILENPGKTARNRPRRLQIPRMGRKTTQTNEITPSSQAPTHRKPAFVFGLTVPFRLVDQSPLFRMIVILIGIRQAFWLDRCR
jgi:hypothetical protein